jgi:hypothetical protein
MVDNGARIVTDSKNSSLKFLLHDHNFVSDFKLL